MGAEAERRPSGRSSALMAQYLRIRGHRQAAIRLFRLGDFYGMFFEDAETASRVLDLTLTARNRGDPDEVPLCGFPAHAAQPYVARLLAAGHPVAICEQSEARGRGLLEREVVRVVTPGTILEEESLDPAAPSLLAALAADGDRYGLAAIDFATGAFRATEVAGWAAAREELERLGPRELLLAPGLPEDITAACRTGRPWATALLPEPAALAEALPPLAQRAAGGALAYVDAVYRRRPAHLRAPESYAPAGFLQLDGATRRNLELLETLGGDRRGSLLWVLDQTASPMGARRLRDWLLYPLLDAAAIGRRLDAVEELVDAVELRASVRARLAGIGDLERLAGRVGARTAGPRDLAHLAVALDRVADVRTALGAARAEAFATITAALDALPDVSAEIVRTLVDAPPPHIRLPGFIRAGCSTEVDALRDAARDGKGWLARFEAAERARTGITSLKVRHNRVFGYYVEVTRPNLALVPLDYERKQTLVGAERFVTPALKEHEARVLGAEERLRGLEAHLFEALLDTVALHQPSLARTAGALAQVDALAALGEVAHRRAYVRPRSVVVLDEIGRGTSTFDGISIAWAVAEHLHDTAERPRTLFATHYHELTALAAEHPRVRNLSVAVAEWKGEIVFLRQIVPGPAPRSYGVEVARLAGVPEPVVARARTLLAGLETGRGPVGRGPEPPAAQLSLFTPTEEQLRRELAVLDPERLTPIEALAVLARLVAAARRE